MDRRLLVLALGMFALGTDNFVVAGVLLEIACGFHIGIGAAGQVKTIYALSFALLAPTVAALAAQTVHENVCWLQVSRVVVLSRSRSHCATISLIRCSGDRSLTP